MEQTCHVIDLYDPLGALAFAFHHSGFHVIKSLDSVNEKELPILTRNNTTQLCPRVEIENLIETNRCKPYVLTSQIYWAVSSDTEKSFSKKENLDEIISAVQKFRPACLVFETRMKFKNSRAFENLLNLLQEDRYSVFWRLLNPREYAGIPLKEKRLYIIALSEALGKEFSFPAPIGIKRDPFDFLEPGKSYIHSERIRRSCTERGICSNSELEQPLRQAANVYICRMIVESIQKLLRPGAENSARKRDRTA